jgi:CIC family chloride channel protein
VDAGGRLTGIITRGDMVVALQHDSIGKISALDAGSTELMVAYPDDTLHDAIGKMLRQNVGRLPVVERDNSTRIVGYLGRTDILAARLRRHEEEERREKGPIMSLGKRKPVSPQE